MRSCGLLLYRTTPGLELWLGHMGGPFWARKDAAGWSIPKGEPLPGEADLAAAIREFTEEIGAPPPAEEFVLVGEFVQSSRKTIAIFAAETTAEVTFEGSNEFELEWPPRSGRIQSFPEIDRAEWVSAERARTLLVAGQVPVLDALERALAA
ncbi:MAG: hypothetical protein JWN36_2016 [Microbacteriaceae bacterium]|nr:hypothetical protein [Microbacteriaceae bacterium]